MPELFCWSHMSLGKVVCGIGVARVPFSTFVSGLPSEMSLMALSRLPFSVVRICLTIGCACLYSIGGILSLPGALY